MMLQVIIWRLVRILEMVLVHMLLHMARLVVVAGGGSSVADMHELAEGGAEVGAIRQRRFPK